MASFIPRDLMSFRRCWIFSRSRSLRPVQFVKGLQTLYDAGARVFVEVGPKKALQGFAEEVLGDRGDVVSLFTNHPKVGDIPSFNQALCGLYAAGLGRGQTDVSLEPPGKPAVSQTAVAAPANDAKPTPLAATAPATFTAPPQARRMAIPTTNSVVCSPMLSSGAAGKFTAARSPPRPPNPVMITGASLGLPGTERIFDDSNVERILRGDQFISAIPAEFRHAMLDKHIRRLVKSEKGEATFESITDVADVIKLAGRGGAFDLESEFGVPAEHLAAFDRVTRLAIGAGIDALRDAGIPLVMRYKTTSKGTQLPDRWGLPDAMRDDTGVIFGSAFPGCDSFADIMSRYYTDHARREQLAMLEELARPRGGKWPFGSWGRDWTGASRSCTSQSKKSRMSSTGASCSGSCRWDIRSSPNSSALAVPTRRSTQPARPPHKPLRWRRTGSAPDGAAA